MLLTGVTPVIKAMLVLGSMMAYWEGTEIKLKRRLALLVIPRRRLWG